jgi:hypothetical protein
MNKTFWWIVTVVIIVLAVWAFVNKSGTPLDLSGSPSPSVGASPSTSATSSGIGATTYSALVAQYGTNRIQFDAGCQAIPKVAVFKTGTKVMFDNRSGDARIITIGGVKYSFLGYGYRIIKLGSTQLPATVKLNCGSAINVGTITVEK